jgi:hypothetical protein
MKSSIALKYAKDNLGNYVVVPKDPNWISKLPPKPKIKIVAQK